MTEFLPRRAQSSSLCPFPPQLLCIFYYIFVNNSSHFLLINFVSVNFCYSARELQWIKCKFVPQIAKTRHFHSQFLVSCTYTHQKLVCTTFRAYRQKQQKPLYQGLLLRLYWRNYGEVIMLCFRNQPHGFHGLPPPDELCPSAFAVPPETLPET